MHSTLNKKSSELLAEEGFARGLVLPIGNKEPYIFHFDLGDGHVQTLQTLQAAFDLAVFGVNYKSYQQLRELVALKSELDKMGSVSCIRWERFVYMPANHDPREYISFGAWIDQWVEHLSYIL